MILLNDTPDTEDYDRPDNDYFERADEWREVERLEVEVELETLQQIRINNESKLQ